MSKMKRKSKKSMNIIEEFAEDMGDSIKKIAKKMKK